MKNPAGIYAFSRHLRKLREERGLSQQALADHADIAKPTVQRIEYAQATPTLDVLISLARALTIPLRELVDFVYVDEG